jgi:hypothetical protein
MDFILLSTNYVTISIRKLAEYGILEILESYLEWSWFFSSVVYMANLFVCSKYVE